MSNLFFVSMIPDPHKKIPAFDENVRGKLVGKAVLTKPMWFILLFNAVIILPLIFLYTMIYALSPGASLPLTQGQIGWTVFIDLVLKAFYMTGYFFLDMKRRSKGKHNLD